MVVALATTFPLWLHLADAVPGDIGDPLLNTWILAWDVHALLADPLHLFDANIFYPLPNTVAYSEHMLSTALLAMPLALVTGEPVVAYNLSLLLSFPIAGLGMYLLVLSWTRRRRAALLAGLAFAFAPYRLAAFAHLQLLTLQWLPFSLLALEWMLREGSGVEDQGSRITHHASRVTHHASRVTHHALFVVFASLQVLASWYLAVFSVLVWGVYLVGWLAAQRIYGSRAVWERLPGLVVSGLIVMGVMLPFALPYLEVLPQLQAARPTSLGASFGAQPSDFLAAASHLRLAGPITQPLADRPGFTEENTLFPGLIAPLLALLGLLRVCTGRQLRERWRVVALLAILVVSLALTFAGPYRWLVRLLPALAVIRVPARWMIPATFALAGLAGYGAAWPGGDERRRLTKDRGRKGDVHRSGVAAVCGLILTLLVAESFAAPLPLALVGDRGELPPVYYALRDEALHEPGRWGVVELPMYAAPAPEFPETKRLYASTLGWWGLVNGYSGFTPERQVMLGQDLADFPGEEALEAVRRLGGSGVRYLVVHPDEAPMNRAEWEASGRWQVERNATLLPLGSFGPDDLYLINPYGDELITDPSIARDTYWSARVPTPIDVRFQVSNSTAEIRLLAYRELGMGGLEDRPTESRLFLYWQALTSLDIDYTVFVHSRDAEGRLIGQADGPPVAGHYPTSTWQPGEIVQDSRVVPPGAHYLIGLYDAATGERLPAYGTDGVRLIDEAAVLVGGWP